MHDEYVLRRGPHIDPINGRCAMEWVAHLAGEPHSDSPACVDPVITVFCIVLNDSTHFAERQRLRPYLARCIGTADDGLRAMREQMLREWFIASGAYVNASDLDFVSIVSVRYQSLVSPDKYSSALELLDRMLPTVHVEVPIADQVCVCEVV